VPIYEWSKSRVRIIFLKAQFALEPFKVSIQRGSAGIRLPRPARPHDMTGLLPDTRRLHATRIRHFDARAFRPGSPSRSRRSHIPVPGALRWGVRTHVDNLRPPPGDTVLRPALPGDAGRADLMLAVLSSSPSRLALLRETMAFRETSLPSSDPSAGFLMHVFMLCHRVAARAGRYSLFVTCSRCYHQLEYQPASILNMH
jgi:hypothetical protein